MDATIGLRVTADEEEIGLDLTQHGERGYIMGAGELMVGHGGPGSDTMAKLSTLASEPVTQHASY